MPSYPSKQWDLPKDSNGFVVMSKGTLDAGEDLVNDRQLVEQRFSYFALASLVTVNIKAGSGLLHTVAVGGFSGPTIEIYDNTAASSTLIGRIPANAVPGTYTFDVAFSTGLTVNPQPGSGILPMITVSYR